MDKALIDNLTVRISDLGLKLLGAAAIWFIGRWLIHFVLNMVVARLEKKKVDHTIVGYAKNTAAVALNIALVVMLMGVLGIETTSFAAFIAGAGLAIGAAWSGLLSNLAAGAFLVVLRPFKAGDFIGGGGIMGTVVEVGLFVTTITTLDGIRTYVGNSKLLGDNLKNFSANPARRIELTGTVPRHADVHKVMAEVKAKLLTIPNVLADPAPEVTIFSADIFDIHLAVRPWAHNDHYWQVYFDTTDGLKDMLTAIGLHGAAGGHEGAGEGAAAEAEEAEEEESAAAGGEKEEE